MCTVAPGLEKPSEMPSSNAPWRQQAKAPSSVDGHANKQPDDLLQKCQVALSGGIVTAASHVPRPEGSAATRVLEASAVGWSPAQAGLPLQASTVCPLGSQGCSGISPPPLISSLQLPGALSACLMRHRTCRGKTGTSVGRKATYWDLQEYPWSLV